MFGHGCPLPEPGEPLLLGVLVCALEVWLLVVWLVVVLVVALEELGAAAAPAIPASAPVPASAAVTSSAFTFVDPLICLVTSLHRSRICVA